VQSKLETRRRVRRAAEIITEHEATVDREEVLWLAQELLQGLRRDQFPEELRPKFDYLAHELSLRKSQEMTIREINFLLECIREIDRNWSEAPESIAEAGQDGA
jgi:hypothetical protein